MANYVNSLDVQRRRRVIYYPQFWVLAVLGRGTMTKTSRHFLLPVCLAGMLLAQGDRGSITGAVTDAGGARIPAVRITATQRETNAQFKATTTESGEFVLPSLPIGAYRVVIDSDGF